MGMGTSVCMVCPFPHLFKECVIDGIVQRRSDEDFVLQITVVALYT